MFLLRRFAPRRTVENAHAVRAAGHRLADQAAATDKSERLVPHERAEQMTRLGTENFPAGTMRSPSTTRRATASSNANARAAVASVVLAGTTVTGMPRAVAAST